jgi:hypothetical protein
MSEDRFKAMQTQTHLDKNLLVQLQMHANAQPQILIETTARYIWAKWKQRPSLKTLGML